VGRAALVLVLQVLRAELEGLEGVKKEVELRKSISTGVETMGREGTLSWQARQGRVVVGRPRGESWRIVQSIPRSQQARRGGNTVLLPVVREAAGNFASPNNVRSDLESSHFSFFPSFFAAAFSCSDFGYHTGVRRYGMD